MNSRIISCVAVAAVLLLNVQLANCLLGGGGTVQKSCGCGGRGAEGQLARCNQLVGFLGALNVVPNALLDLPCELLACLLGVKCMRRDKCDPIIGALSELTATLVNSFVCDENLIACPGNETLRIVQCFTEVL